MGSRNNFLNLNKNTPETHSEINFSKNQEGNFFQEASGEKTSQNAFSSRQTHVTKNPQIIYFDSSQIKNTLSSFEPSNEEFANEPSLLEELDIDLEAVKSKLKSTLFFFRPNPEFAKKPDLVGPLILATILGCILVLVR